MSQSTSSNNEAIATLLQIEKDCEDRKELASRKLPPPLPLKSYYPGWNHTTGPDTEYQTAVLFWWLHYGLSGLPKYIINWATKKAASQSRATQYKTLSEDKDNGNLIPFYIATMLPRMITAVICNNLPSRLKDAEFRKEVEEWADIADKYGPGAYCISVADKETGMVPTPNELLKVVSYMRRYIDLQDAAFRKEAELIDICFPRNITVDYRTEHRYMGTTKKADKDPFQAIIDWLNVIQEEYLNELENALRDPTHQWFLILDKQISRCFPYIGWATNVEERSHNHKVHSQGENQNFGLYSAVMQHLYGPKYHIERHVLFYALDGDHSGFLEILGHALAGSWHSLGGFNAWWAGGRGYKGLDDLRCQKQIERHLKMVKDSGHIKQNLDQSLNRLKKTDAVYNVNLDDVVKDMEEEQQAFLKRVEDLQTYAESIRLAIHAKEIEDAITAFDLADEIE